MDTLAGCILGAVVMIGFMSAITTAAQRGAPITNPDTGSLVFRYTLLLRVGSVCAVLGAPAGLTALLVVHPPKDQGDIIAVVLAYAMLTAPWVALVWDVFRFRLVVGPDGLDCRSPWRRRTFIRWTDVADVSFNGPVGWFEVRATDGRTFRTSALMGGLDAFLEACEQHLAPNQLEPARDAYVYLERSFPGEERSDTGS
jgi:hypothetical protein